MFGVKVADAPFHKYIEEVGEIRVHDRVVVRRIDNHGIKLPVPEWQLLGITPDHPSRFFRHLRAVVDDLAHGLCGVVPTA